MHVLSLIKTITLYPLEFHFVARLQPTPFFFFLRQSRSNPLILYPLINSSYITPKSKPTCAFEILMVLLKTVQVTLSKHAGVVRLPLYRKKSAVSAISDCRFIVAREVDAPGLEIKQGGVNVYTCKHRQFNKNILPFGHPDRDNGGHTLVASNTPIDNRYQVERRF